MTPELVTAFTLVMLAGLLLAEWQGNHTLVWLFKPLASLGFVTTGWLLRSGDGGYVWGVLAAQVLSAVGDVFLIPKNKRAFLAGLVSFLLGHVVYATAFVARGVATASVLVAAVPMALAAVVVGRWLLPNVEQKMRVPVLAYMGVISVMVSLAVGTHVSQPVPIALAAAVIFYLSDLSVARDRFVKKEFINRAWGLPFYYGAQLLFAWSLR